jgi:hypothetical protein
MLNEGMLKPVSVVVRLLRGEAWQLQRVNLLTRVGEVKAEVFSWAFEHSTCEDSDFFEIELAHQGAVLHDDMETLGEVGVAMGDEIQLVGRLDLPPPLVSDSD